MQGKSIALNYTLIGNVLTIDKAHLTVKADTTSKTYDGSTFSPFTSTITGFVDGESAAVVTG